MLRIIHGADLHLDSAFASLPPEQAVQRRRHQRQLLPPGVLLFLSVFHTIHRICPKQFCSRQFCSCNLRTAHFFGASVLLCNTSHQLRNHQRHRTVYLG